MNICIDCGKRTGWPLLRCYCCTIDNDDRAAKDNIDDTIVAIAKVESVDCQSRAMIDTPNAPRCLCGDPIGYRHNPCRACGKQVVTLGCTLCLDCVCAAADTANLRMPDLAKVDEAEIAADLRALSPDECASRGIRHSSADHDHTALSDADTDEHFRQALRSATGRCGL